ncbi:hypothetical protein Ade02nite_34670 [Paractinoplanes deccanensis]|uniref:Trypsin-like peptidase domain-containing protein n=1 Tax=Paractinoplanes deccanensis TaxID=113561 RepID=A0ABQ3Y4B3_9ACTN|nr:trypsin-like peptidase domain-containing protein [Actinoplanes deccanensis]GID74826.1 hypothetical protein Ade02nite_34670 [Actinoplanes deccanensis]
MFTSLPLAEMLRAQDRTRAAELAAFSGCLRGGVAEHLDQGASDVRIYGAGVWLSQEVSPIPGGGTHPLVLADPSLLDGEETGSVVWALDHPLLLAHLRAMTGGAAPAQDLVAVSADMPREHFEETGKAVAGGLRGVFGARVTMNGAPGILTAGHVTSPNATSQVHRRDGHQACDATGACAPVVFASHAGTTTRREPLADVAVVELPQQATKDQRIGAPTVAGPDEQLRRLGGSGRGRPGERYRALCTWVRVNNRTGLWGDVYMTEKQIGRAGDSGSAVVDSQGRLVGHYLGATSANGFVQQIFTQLPPGCSVP